MKITLLTVGKTANKYLQEELAVYEKRLQRYVNYARRDLPDVRHAGALPADQLKIQEGKRLLQQLSGTDELFLFDERGQAFSSEEMAGFLKQKMDNSIKSLVFAIGGAYGFSPEVYQRAAGLLSLSRMTFSHQMVRLIATEQLYRALTIIKGEPYHHGI
ncbi:MAG: 23S rRNA (pseudouridine(1915)-N(3))-methyltransferase RlmH [Prevotellaceae bacterium]|jgi:23S rRNA (pseudouridine1915-N3)-methyltransferase|nr:23S rRNA (pseudouridine(1915)-N(3))-methyltransferase RlmH [Prevotellaceae bacterium]